MKKKAKILVNRNLKLILVVAVIIVIGLGFLLMLISGNQERGEVDVNKGDATKQTEQREQAKKSDYANVSDEALDLYNVRVDDISDSSAVAQLLEKTTMRKELGGYMVTLNVKESPKGMLIKFEEKVDETKQNAFEDSIKIYAEQILALVSEAEEVQWTYTLVKNSKEETIEDYMNTKAATGLLGMDVKEYAKSPEMVQTLLNNQKGIR